MNHYVVICQTWSPVASLTTPETNTVFSLLSSCPDVGQQCSWRDAQVSRGNPQVLFGALVGGPNRYDVYEDTRNPNSNDVALDYTAGLMTAVAGLKESTQRTKNVRYFGRWSG